jgi:hypothetical protein
VFGLADLRTSWPSFLDENADQGLKISTIAQSAPNEGDPAAALAAVLGRPFPGIELFDRIPDTVFFIKDREARYVAVNETLVHRCKLADSHALIGRRASVSKRRISGSSPKCSRSAAGWSSISIRTALKAGV